MAVKLEGGLWLTITQSDQIAGEGVQRAVRDGAWARRAGRPPQQNPYPWWHPARAQWRFRLGVGRSFEARGEGILDRAAMN